MLTMSLITKAHKICPFTKCPIKSKKCPIILYAWVITRNFVDFVALTVIVNIYSGMSRNFYTSCSCHHHACYAINYAG